MPGIQSSSRGTTCFCPPSQIDSVANGRAIALNIPSTAVVRCFGRKVRISANLSLVAIEASHRLVDHLKSVISSLQQFGHDQARFQQRHCSQRSLCITHTGRILGKHCQKGGRAKDRNHRSSDCGCQAASLKGIRIQENLNNNQTNRTTGVLQSSCSSSFSRYISSDVSL